MKILLIIFENFIPFIYQIYRKNDKIEIGFTILNILLSILQSAFGGLFLILSFMDTFGRDSNEIRVFAIITILVTGFGKYYINFKNNHYNYTVFEILECGINQKTGLYVNKMFRKDEKDNIYIIHSGDYNKPGSMVNVSLNDYNKEFVVFEKNTYLLLPKKRFS